jgi:ATP adenylyltransferase
MDILFTPWRLSYLTGEGTKPEGCLFCGLRALADADALIVHRGALVYALLNRYPYSNGHLMLTPYAHRATLAAMTRDERSELLDLAAAAEEILAADLKPHGFNMGLNLGKSAGAGVPGHAHLHVVPRWDADTNFMTVVGGTRTVPEELGATRNRLARAFAARVPRPEGSA